MLLYLDLMNWNSECHALRPNSGKLSIISLYFLLAINIPLIRNYMNVLMVRVVANTYDFYYLAKVHALVSCIDNCTNNYYKSLAQTNTNCKFGIVMKIRYVDCFKYIPIEIIFVTSLDKWGLWWDSIFKKILTLIMFVVALFWSDFLPLKILFVQDRSIGSHVQILHRLLPCLVGWRLLFRFININYSEFSIPGPFF